MTSIDDEIDAQTPQASAVSTEAWSSHAPSDTPSQTLLARYGGAAVPGAQNNCRS